MSLNNYTKMSAFSLICLLGSISDSSAQWPTLDVSAIFQDAKSIVQQVQQYKTQIEEAKTTGFINTAIGDAASSMGAFNMDKIEAAKKKAEKAKKKAEKIQKVKEKIQKAKEEYKKKKEQYDKYKKKVDEAKDIFNEAKDLAATAKAEYNSIKSQASSKINTAKSQIKTKVSSSTPQNNNKTVAATPQLSNNQRQVSNTNTVQTNANNNIPAQNVQYITPQGKVQQKSLSSNAVNQQNINSTTNNAKVTGRTSFSAPSSANTNKATKPQTTASKIENIKTTASTQGSTAGTATFHQTLNKAIEENDVETLEALSDIDTADVINSDSKVYDETEDSKDSTPTLVPALSRTKPALQTISNTVTTGGRKAFSAPQGVITTDEPEARDEPVTTSSSAKLTPKTNVRLGGGGGGRVEDIVSTDHDSKSSKQLQAVQSRL